MCDNFVMKTKIGGLELVDEAAKLLKSGQLVAFATETVYGLGANALDGQAIKKIYEAKGRPSDNPLIVHICDTNMLNMVAKDVPAIAKNLFMHFSPGPLTLVLKRNDKISACVAPNLDTVAVRIPNHPLALELIKKATIPIAAPSANISGSLSPTTAQAVFEDFDGKIQLILDGGTCEVGIESTVLDLTTDIPTILRPGRIKPKDLLAVLPKVLTQTGELLHAKSPGTKYKHYAPKIKCQMAKDIKEAKSMYDDDKNAVIIGSSGFVAACGKRNAISLGDNIDDIEHNYFTTLRIAQEKFDLIILETFYGEEAAAIMDRMKKSCGKI